MPGAQMRVEHRMGPRGATVDRAVGVVVDYGHAGCCEASGSLVLFDDGWSYRRRSGFSLEHAADRGAPPDRSE
jgi:hypothetical protein